MRKWLQVDHGYYMDGRTMVFDNRPYELVPLERSLADDPQAVEIRWCMTHRCSVSGNNIACWQFHYDWKGKGVDPSESGCAIRVLRAAEGEDG